jgi:hypothetical protein
MQLAAHEKSSKKFEERVHVIEEILNRYERPFTLLGIGEDMGSVVEKKALDYPESTFVVLDGSLENANTLSSLPNILWLNHQLLCQEARDLASCEHVDVLLLLNCLHMFSEEWREALHFLKQMAHIVIVELPKQVWNRENLLLKAMHRHLSHFSNVAINETASAAFYILENKEPFRLIRTTFIHPRKLNRSYEIYCDYTQKYLKKIRPNWATTTPWFPGINMMTYLLFNGTVPSRSQVLAHLPLDQEHSDWIINNMIIQGNEILLIDRDDPTSTPIQPDEGKRFRSLEECAKEFILTTPGMSPIQVKEAFISIYKWENYFDKDEIEE